MQSGVQATVTDSSLRTANETSLLEAAVPCQPSAETDADLTSSSLSGTLPPQPQQPQRPPSDCNLTAAVHGDSCLPFCQARALYAGPVTSEEDSSMLLLYPGRSPALTILQASHKLSTSTQIDSSSLRGGHSDALWKFGSQEQQSTLGNRSSLSDEEDTATICEEKSGEDPKTIENLRPEDAKAAHSSPADIPTGLPRADGLAAVASKDVGPVYAVLSLLPAPEKTFLSSDQNPPQNLSPDTSEIEDVSAMTSCPEDSTSPPVSPRSAHRNDKILPQPTVIFAKLSKRPSDSAALRQQPRRDCSILPVGRRPPPASRKEPQKPQEHQELQKPQEESREPQTPQEPDELQKLQKPEEPQSQSTLSTSAVVVTAVVHSSPSASSTPDNDWAMPPTFVGSDNTDEDEVTLADTTVSMDCLSRLQRLNPTPLFAQSDLVRDPELLSVLQMMKMPWPHAHSDDAPMHPADDEAASQSPEVLEQRLPTRIQLIAELQEESRQISSATSEHLGDTEISLPTVNIDL